MTLLERVLKRCVRAPNGCLEWTGAVQRKGYGVIGVGSRGLVLVHRTVLEAALGRKLGEGEQALHSCDNRRCCERSHLRAGTPKENTADMLARGREAWGEHSGTAKLSEKAIGEIFELRRRGLTQQRIADLFGINQAQISRVLNQRAWRRVTSA